MSDEIKIDSTKAVQDMLAAWDSGDPIWSIEMGGMGPGYEQTLQIMAVEFARQVVATPELFQIKDKDIEKKSNQFRCVCQKALKSINEGLGGVSGAQFDAATWLAWQWCFNGGPEKLKESLKEKGKEDRLIMVSRFWPKAPEPPQPTPNV